MAKVSRTLLISIDDSVKQGKMVNAKDIEAVDIAPAKYFNLEQ